MVETAQTIRCGHPQAALGGGTHPWSCLGGLPAVYADDAQDPGEPGTRIMTYAYDGLNRLAYSHDNYYYHFYYNEQRQTLEVRKNNPADGDPERQYVWDIRYIDAPVVRFFDGNLDGDYADEDDNVLYYCNDGGGHPKEC